MARNKIGFHLGTGGNKTGYGDYIRALDAAGIPAFVGSMSGEGFGDVKAQWDAGSTVPHVVVVRYMPDSGQDVPAYGTDVNAAVDAWLNWYAPKIGNDVKQYHQRVITKHGNELDKNQLVWLAGFYPVLHAELLRRMGWASHRICCFSFASGEPEPEQWEQPEVLNFLRLAGDNPDKFVIGLHEYSYANTLDDGYPYKIGRFQKLYEICDRHGIKRPLIAIHEFGWRQDTLPDPGPAMGQIQNFAAPLYCDYDTVLGAAIWTTQQGYGGIAEKAQRLIAPVRDMTINVVFDDPTPPDPPTPPGDKPKIVIVKKPQKADMTLAENQTVGEWAWNQYGRTTTHSTDDTLTMLAGGNDESYAVIPYPDRQEEDIAALEAAGYAWQAMDGSPLAGLRLGHLFAYRYQLTSPFNAPRSYGNHEGADYDIIGGAANNTTMVLCAYPGTVDRSLDSTGGYGKYVRVAHSRNGKPFYTWYCHLDTRTAVTIGASIAKGAPVGEVGTTGNVTGEHVHFNLEVPDYGLRGYVVDWVVDPAPYLPTPAEMSSLPPVPTGEAIDLTRFKEADPYCWRVVRLADGRTEDVQDKQLGSGLFVRRKGNNGEWHQRRADGYYLVHDTSPAPDSQGNERVYTLYKNNVAGAQKSRLSQRIGEGWQENGTHYVQFRAKSDCRNLSENSGNASNSSVITRRETNYTFNRYGQNLTFDEVIWEQTGQETQIYGRKNGKSCGWIGWSAPWGECEPVEIHWDRGILTQEPNRWCGW